MPVRGFERDPDPMVSKCRTHLSLSQLEVFMFQIDVYADGELVDSEYDELVEVPDIVERIVN